MTTDEASPDPYHDVYSKTVFGFWIYLLTDFVLFATIFAAYVVMSGRVFGGPSAKDLFDLHWTFVQTMFLMLTSLTVGFAGVCIHRKNKQGGIVWFIITFILGAIFLWMQLQELTKFVQAGHSWQGSAFLSLFFTLVGTFALHVSTGLLWTIVLVIPLFRSEINTRHVTRLTCLRIFWQFLGVVWVFIFNIVYLMGVG